MIKNLTNEEYDICTDCMHASVCKYSLKVKDMIETIDNAITYRVALEPQDMLMPVLTTRRCIVEYPLKLKVECELFKAKSICRS